MDKGKYYTTEVYDSMEDEFTLVSVKCEFACDQFAVVQYFYNGYYQVIDKCDYAKFKETEGSYVP